MAGISLLTRYFFANSYFVDVLFTADDRRPIVMPIIDV